LSHLTVFYCPPGGYGPQCSLCQVPSENQETGWDALPHPPQED
jgi:hypothetical protein